jgi:hypothetical protein
VKCEFGDATSGLSRGALAGVAELTRALGSSGESERPSCSAVQHNLEAMAAREGVMMDGCRWREGGIGLKFAERSALAPRGVAAASGGKEVNDIA